MNFDYKKIAPGILRPIIPVVLEHKGILFDYSAMIDSGADYSLFPAEVADSLGIEVKQGKQMSVVGISGKKEFMYVHDIVLQVGGRSHKTKAAFMYGFQDCGHGLLGQKGFFDLFVIKFDLIKERIELFERKPEKK